MVEQLAQRSPQRTMGKMVPSGHRSAAAAYDKSAIDGTILFVDTLDLIGFP